MEVVYFNRCKGYRYSIEKVTSYIAGEISKNNSVKELDAPCYKFTIINAIKNIWYVYRNRSKTGVNHITGDIHYCILGLIGVKSVVTIHDLVFLQGEQKLIKKFLNYFLWLWLPVRFADKIVCISEKTRKELLEHIKTDKITVIYDPVRLDGYCEFTEEFNTECPKILHVGTKPNKNLSRTIEALSVINCELIIIGKPCTEDLELLKKVGIKHRILVDISDEELAQEYGRADILSFASTYEGFGMPIVEAQLSNCLVVTSNIPPMTEVGGGAAIYVNPYSVQDIRNGFLKLLNDASQRQFLLSKNKENAERFLPSNIAEQYSNLYTSLLK